MGLILGIESTAHTFSFGAVSSDGVSVLPSHSSLYRPEEGGIHPREAADHHVNSSRTLLEKAMDDWGFQEERLMLWPSAKAQDSARA